MSNFSFAGEINRDNAMGAVADTMNSLSLDILKATMEMGGKQVVSQNGNAYAMERLDDTEVKALVTEAGDVVDASLADTIFDIIGISPDSEIAGGIETDASWSINITAGDATDNPGGASLKISYLDANTGDVMVMGVDIDKNGECVGLSPLKASDETTTDAAILSADLETTEVDGGGLLKSWGIDNPEELQPGDLFLVQQKLQIIKDTVSAVHTTGKTQGDIMREATQKFAQG